MLTYEDVDPTDRGIEHDNARDVLKRLGCQEGNIEHALSMAANFQTGYPDGGLMTGDYAIVVVRHPNFGFDIILTGREG
jgi:hypothetical protein